MTSTLRRRDSMTFLSLYDLEAFQQDAKIKLQDKTMVSKSVLEDLANELLIDIFEYFSPYDLHRSVYNLNMRLNTICETQKLRLNLSGTKRAFDYYCSNQQPFASQIYSLNLDDNYDRLTLFHQAIDMNLFTNLRRLTIREPSSENLDQILSKSDALSHLSYFNLQWALIQSSSITEVIFKLRSLKCLILCSTDSITLHFDNNSIHPFTELEYLEMNDCCVIKLLELLQYMGPNLKRMKIRLRYLREQDIPTIDSIRIDDLLSQHRLPVLLRRLEVKFNFLPLTNFHSILRLFPSLTHLIFSTMTNDLNFVTPSVWYEFLSTNLLELKQLQFYIEIRGLLGNVIQCPSTELIDSFYSMNSKWLVGPVIMDYNSLIAPVLEIYTYPLSKRVGKYSLEFYDKKRYTTRTVNDVPINIDKNITDLRIRLTDNQQLTTTTNDSLSIYGTSVSYPKVTELIIHSQLTRSSVDNEKRISLIIPDLIKSIPDLSKITSLNFTTDSSIPSIYPSSTLVRRLLAKMPKVYRLELSYNHLLHLLKSPLIIKLLGEKIETLTLIFDTNPPILPDMLRILNIFSTKLHFLSFEIRMDCPAKRFYFILPSLFSGICKKLYSFRLRLYTKIQQQPQVFDEQFKLKLKSCLTAQLEKNKAKSGTMEYRIQNDRFSISF